MNFEDALKNFVKELVESWINEEGRNLIADEVGEQVPNEQELDGRINDAVDEAFKDKDFAENSDLESYGDDLTKLEEKVDALQTKVETLEGKLKKYENLLEFLGSVINLPDKK